jgi:hypothetical protein
MLVTVMELCVLLVAESRGNARLIQNSDPVVVASTFHPQNLSAKIHLNVSYHLVLGLTS